jgi:hypothetical protein
MLKINYIIPLGSNCYIASYLKKNNLKLVSYPFDWIFSYPNDIYDIINTDFEHFLNKDNYIYKDEDINYNNHSIYCPMLRMFNHHNPYKEKDYKYFKRCILRFNDVLKKEEIKLFIMFFSENNLNNEIRNIIKIKELLDTKTVNYELLCIFQEVRGYQCKKDFKYKNINFIQISTIDKNNGVEFICEKDEVFFNSIISSLYDFQIYTTK